MTPSAWQGSHWSAKSDVNGKTRPGKIPTEKTGIEPMSAVLEVDGLTTRPRRRSPRLATQDHWLSCTSVTFSLTPQPGHHSHSLSCTSPTSGAGIMEADDRQSDDSFHSLTVIPPSALDKPSIIKRYHRRQTCMQSHLSTFADDGNAS